jgi:hypothetical protein
MSELVAAILASALAVPAFVPASAGETVMPSTRSAAHVPASSKSTPTVAGTQNGADAKAATKKTSNSIKKSKRKPKHQTTH